MSNSVEVKGFSNPVIAVRKWLEPKLPADVAIDEVSYNTAVHAVGYQPYLPGMVIDSLDAVNNLCELSGLTVTIQSPFVYFEKTR
jgi:hypothetical protein